MVRISARRRWWRDGENTSKEKMVEETVRISARRRW